VTTWRYALYGLRSRAEIAHHIPWTISSYERMLSEAGTMQQATISLGDPRVQAMGLTTKVLPRRTTLVILRDEQVVWEGIIWTRRYKRSEGQMVIAASELRSYFDSHRILRPDSPGDLPTSAIDKVLSFHQVDQLAIFRALLDDAQTSIVRNGQMPGDLGIEMDTTQMSGVLRDREDVGDQKGAYRGTQFQSYGQLFDDLAGVENGFEWRIDSYLDADRQLRRRLILGYPQIGRPADLDSLTLESPGRITDWEWQEDGESSANYVAAIGSNATDDANSPVIWGDAWGDAELQAGYPLLETTTSYSTVQQPATINEHATADLAANTGDLVIPSVDVKGYPLVSPGDYIRLRLRDTGWFGEQPYEAYVRVIGQTVTPGPNEKTTLALQQGRARQTLPRDQYTSARRYAALERRITALEAAR
jgi:hypothetical protein